MGKKYIYGGEITMKNKLLLTGVMFIIILVLSGFTYNNKFLSFEYSQDWEVVEDKCLEDLSFLVLSLKDDRDIGIGISGSWKDFTIEYFQSYASRKREEDFKDLTIIERKPLTIMGHPAYQLIMKDGEQGSMEQGRLYKYNLKDTYYNGTIISFIYYAPVDRYDENLSKVNEIFKGLSGKTSLSYLCKYGTVKEVKQAVENDMDPNTYEIFDGKKIIPLISAIQRRNIEMTRLLIEAGAEVNVKDDAGYTPLLMAIEKGHGEIVKTLLQKGADIYQKRDEWGPLMYGVKTGNLEIIKLLLEQGADIEQRAEIDGVTPLIIAAREENMEVIEFLLEAGADIENGGLYGNTPLIEAADSGKITLIRYLVEQGAKINTRNELGRTALMEAASKGKLYSVKILLKLGAKIGLRDNNGRTALDLASAEGHQEVVDYLKERNDR